MLVQITCLISVLATLTPALQPGAPAPPKSPLRDLHIQDLNFLHTTDVHGFHAGHRLEPSFSADFGDFFDFRDNLRRRIEGQGKDLIVIDTGDRIRGDGYFEASTPKGKYTYELLKQQDIDLMCSGNHELYTRDFAWTDYEVVVPSHQSSYLASNLDIYDEGTDQFVPFAQRFKKFTTKIQGIRIVAFGFLFDFQLNANNTRVRPVEDVVKERWFEDAVKDQDMDIFLVIGHAAIRSDEFETLFQSIRAIHPKKPIQFVGGHWHIRDYKKFDDLSYGIASGRYAETVGFQSIGGFGRKSEDSESRNMTFFRRYIDFNLYSFYHHSGHNSSTFHSSRALELSKWMTGAIKEMKLDHLYGCAPKSLWTNRAKYPSSDSVYSWLEEKVLPSSIFLKMRETTARFILLNTGAIRYDILKGPFVKDSIYSVSPYDSGFHYILNVPINLATKLLPLLNNEGKVLETLHSQLREWQLGPVQQVWRQSEADDPARPPLSLESATGRAQNLLSPDSEIVQGYTTVDDGGRDGDDTVHSPISFYQVPNCIQAIVNPEGDDAQFVDVLFNDFLQPWIVLGLRFLGMRFDENEVMSFNNGQTFTEMLEIWAEKNWNKDCVKRI